MGNYLDRSGRLGLILSSRLRILSQDLNSSFEEEAVVLFKESPRCHGVVMQNVIIHTFMKPSSENSFLELKLIVNRHSHVCLHSNYADGHLRILNFPASSFFHEHAVSDRRHHPTASVCSSFMTQWSQKVTMLYAIYKYGRQLSVFSVPAIARSRRPWRWRREVISTEVGIFPARFAVRIGCRG